MAAVIEIKRIFTRFAEDGDRRDFGDKASEKKNEVKNKDDNNAPYSSMDCGIPRCYSKAIKVGGKYAERCDINGIGFLATQCQFYLQNGGLFWRDGGYAKSMKGYAKGALLPAMIAVGANATEFALLECLASGEGTSGEFDESKWKKVLPTLSDVSTLLQRVVTEEQNRAEADTTEATTRGEEDAKIQQNVDTLSDSIGQEVTDRQTAIGEVNTRIDEIETEIGTSSSGTLDAAKKYTDEQITSRMGSVYKFVGSVDKKSDLPTPTAEHPIDAGSVYNVRENGNNYAWTGTEWDSLGNEIDFSQFAKQADFEEEVRIRGEETGNLRTDVTALGNRMDVVEKRGTIASESTVHEVTFTNNSREIQSPYTLKGEVEKKADLPVNTPDSPIAVGDTYKVTEEEKFYAWSTGGWVEIQESELDPTYFKSFTSGAYTATAECFCTVSGFVTADVSDGRDFSNTLAGAIMVDDVTVFNFDLREEGVSLTASFHLDVGQTVRLVSVEDLEGSVDVAKSPVRIRMFAPREKTEA